ncbi:MAG: class E sortase [Thermoleophilia bacterium]|nr:class E sortase [Thermoleophilia bacterium]
MPSFLTKTFNSFRTLKLLDGAVMFAVFAAVISVGIFFPRMWLLYIGASLLAVLYSQLFGRGQKKTGYILIVAGLAMLLALPANWAYWVKWDQRNLPAAFEQESAAALVLNQSVLADLQGAAEKEKLRAMATAFKAGLVNGQTIARIEIPRIGMTGIIVEGTDDNSLSKGIGHLEETPLPGMQGNFSIAGDRVLYGAPFLKLNELEAGDEIIVQTTYGLFTYSVYDKKIVTPEDVSVVRSTGEEIITLITCDPPWSTSRRLIVHGAVTSASLL